MYKKLDKSQIVRWKTNSMRKRFYQFILVILIILCGKKLCEHYFKHSLSYQTFVTRNSPENQINDHDSVSETKYVLLWTPFFGQHNWWLDSDNSVPTFYKNFFLEMCPVNSTRNYDCVVTTDTNVLDSVESFDAIIFHGSERRNFFSPAPSTRSPHQRYVVATLEPPSMVHHNFGLDHNFFNWTMTYRLDSDIVWSYDKFIDRDWKILAGPSKTPIWREYDDKFYDEHLIEKIKTKSRMAAWFVSHCNAKSRRDDLTRALQKYIRVDVYGTCGDYRCGYDENCLDLIENKYKFYLSFENELVEDYVTEKLLEFMSIHTVPIVFGGANYTKFAPPHSYIDANDYDTVEDLVKYLIYLNQNPEEYIKYFWWQQYYTVQRYNKGIFCELCDKLHEKKSIEKVYDNIEEWYFGHPIEPHIKF